MQCPQGTTLLYLPLSNLTRKQISWLEFWLWSRRRQSKWYLTPQKESELFKGPCPCLFWVNSVSWCWKKCRPFCELQCRLQRKGRHWTSGRKTFKKDAALVCGKLNFRAHQKRQQDGMIRALSCVFGVFCSLFRFVSKFLVPIVEKVGGQRWDNLGWKSELTPRSSCEVGQLDSCQVQSCRRPLFPNTSPAPSGEGWGDTRYDRADCNFSEKNTRGTCVAGSWMTRLVRRMCREQSWKTQAKRMEPG